jgi:diguanylate cyclase
MGRTVPPKLWLIFLAFGIVAVVVAMVLAPVYGELPPTLVHAYGTLGAVLAAAYGTPGPQKQRLAWALVIGATAFTLAESAALTFLPEGSTAAVAAAGPQHFLSLACMAGLAVAITRFYPKPVRRVATLDAAILTIGIGLVVWALMLDEAFTGRSPRTTYLVGTLVFSSVCFALIWMGLRLAFSSGLTNSRHWLLLAGIGSAALAHFLYDARVSHDGRLVRPAVSVLFWMLGTVFIGAAALKQRVPVPRPPEEAAQDRMFAPRLVFFGLVVLVGPAVVIGRWIVAPPDAGAPGRGPLSAAEAMHILAPTLLSSLLTVLLVGRLGLVAAVAHRRAVSLEKLRQEFAYRALHDPLTELGNRALLQERLAEVGATGRFSLLLLDLDGFKYINDTYGHPAGDRLLIAVADRLRAVSPPDVLVTRLGGDEFALLVPADDPTRAGDLAEAVLAELCRPIDIGGLGVRVTTSIGVFVTPEPTTPSESLRRVDLALYQAKNEGKNRVCRYEPISLDGVFPARPEVNPRPPAPSRQ